MCVKGSKVKKEGSMVESGVPNIALTLGDMAGIGPEIVAKVLAAPPEGCRLLVVDDARVLKASLDRLGLAADIAFVSDPQAIDMRSKPLTMLDLAHATPELLAIGKPCADTGRMAASALARALELAMDGVADGVVYPPLCKDTLDVGDGAHGDELLLLQRIAKAPAMARVVKAGNVLRNSVTGHVPFANIVRLLTKESVLATIEVLREAFNLYGMESPVIAVAALNPHGGEGGQIGREEIDVLGPAIEAARAAGIDCRGPFAADTLYVRALKGEFQGVVNLYHDQGNIAAKVASFGEGVVQYVRSPVPIATVAHGAAFDIAGKGVADETNLREVIAEVAMLARRWRRLPA
jgi:4-hydroxythreonine-4-phosphate dehydrogenase